MIRYITNTYFLIDKIFYTILYIAICIVLANWLRDIYEVIMSATVLVTAFIIRIFWLFQRLSVISFYNDNIVIKKLISGRTEKLIYSDIIEVIHIQAFSLPCKNYIKYQSNKKGKIIKLEITPVVPSNRYVEFAKWIKSLNKNIKITFLPSDSKLIKEFNG